MTANQKSARRARKSRSEDAKGASQQRVQRIIVYTLPVWQPQEKISKSPRWLHACSSGIEDALYYIRVVEPFALADAEMLLSEHVNEHIGTQLIAPDGHQPKPGREAADRGDAGDHKGPPHHHHPTLAPTDLASVDAYWTQLIAPLNERELEVLQLVAAGNSNRAIADVLIVAESTIKWHLRHIYNKLAVHSRMQAVVRARQLKLLPS